MPRCPVCSARLREHSDCRRCGTDLSAWMLVQVQAWRLRQQAMAKLRAGEVELALAMASRACALHSTTAGQRLRAMLQLAAGHGGAVRDSSDTSA